MVRRNVRWGPVAGLVTGLALICAAVLTLLAGCSGSPSATATPAGTIPATAPATATTASGSGTASGSASGSGTASGSVSGSSRSSAVPSRLAIPALGVDAPVVRVAVDDATGALDVPVDVAEVGWWDEGPAPGSSYGTVVLTGHIDAASQGLGALARLRDLNPGSTLTLSTSNGPIRYTVRARREYDKADLPVDVFSSVGAPRLIVISCGGPFNEKTHHYRDNIVVYAVPA